MDVEKVVASEKVKEDRGKVALRSRHNSSIMENGKIIMARPGRKEF